MSGFGYIGQCRDDAESDMKLCEHSREAVHISSTVVYDHECLRDYPSIFKSACPGQLL